MSSRITNIFASCKAGRNYPLSPLIQIAIPTPNSMPLPNIFLRRTLDGIIRLDDSDVGIDAIVDLVLERMRIMGPKLSESARSCW